MVVWWTILGPSSTKHTIWRCCSLVNNERDYRTLLPIIYPRGCINWNSSSRLCNDVTSSTLFRTNYSTHVFLWKHMHTCSHTLLVNVLVRTHVWYYNAWVHGYVPVWASFLNKSIYVKEKEIQELTLYHQWLFQLPMQVTWFVSKLPWRRCANRCFLVIRMHRVP